MVVAVIVVDRRQQHRRAERAVVVVMVMMVILARHRQRQQRNDFDVVVVVHVRDNGMNQHCDTCKRHKHRRQYDIHPLHLIHFATKIAKPYDISKFHPFSDRIPGQIAATVISEFLKTVLISDGNGVILPIDTGLSRFYANIVGILYL